MAMFLLTAPFAGACAETIRELLDLSMSSPGQTVERRLTGVFAQRVLERTGGAGVVGKASLVEKLPEPGCGRFKIELLAESKTGGLVGLGEVRLDMCRGGLPPVPR